MYYRLNFLRATSKSAPSYLVEVCGVFWTGEPNFCEKNATDIFSRFSHVFSDSMNVMREKRTAAFSQLDDWKRGAPVLRSRSTRA